MKKLIMLTAAVGLLAAEDVKASISYGTTGTVSDGSVNAQAIFTLGNGTLTVVLTDLLQNPVSDGVTISGFSFSISGATGITSFGGSGTLGKILNGNGDYTAGSSASSLTHWAAPLSGTTVNMTTLTGGKPNQLIIGPDDHGTLDGSGAYSGSGNNSIFQHTPVVLGSATFTFDITGITANSTLSDVSFIFGTAGGAANTLRGNLLGSVPEPSTVLAGLLLLVPFGVSTVRILRRNKIQATAE